MIDGGVIAAYLAAAVARGGERLVSKAVDAGLDRLSAAVARRMGRGPDTDLARDPRSPAVQAHVGRAIESAAQRDPAFAQELAALLQQLDRVGGRRLINNVRAHVNVQAFDGGYAHFGDYYEGDSYSNDYDPGDEIVAGRGIGRFVAIIGLLVAMAGFVGFASVIYGGFASDGVGYSPLDLEVLPGIPMLPVGFLAFLIGGIVYGLGTSASKAARKRHEQRTRRRPSPAHR